MLTISRLFALFYITSVFFLPNGSWVYQLLGLWYDLFFWLKISSVLFIPFLILYVIRPSFSRWFIVFTSVIIVMGNIGLDFYFGSTKLPLGADVFAYSFNEITQVVNSSGHLTPGNIMIIVVFGFITSVLFYWIHIGIKDSLIVFIYEKVLIIMFCVGGFGIANTSLYKDEFSAMTASNKTGYFINSLKDRYIGSNSSMNFSMSSEVIVPEVIEEKDHTYVDESKFPFLHTDIAQNELGDYFIKSDKAPNIVYIIVESLGRAYSGENAYLGSFTPFFDEMSKSGLYWSNMVSTTGRTFGVLPALMGSLPFSENGFTALKDKMPHHETLLSILGNQGYKSSFYYGGHSEFDDMDIFMKRQNITSIVDVKNFGKGFAKMPSDKGGETWGYGDKALFSKYIKSSPKDTIPNVDIILTLSTHDPFLINEQKKYLVKAKKYISGLPISKEQKENDLNYEKQFASLLYFDDALKQFIVDYKKRPDFSNTIFVITGDHRMPEIPIASQLDRFHVPLLIWSPLLKKSARFNSISSHFDVLPSMLSLLNSNFGIQIPNESSIIGTGLDVNQAFRNTHSYPLMRNKSEFMDYIDKDYFLSGSTLFKISSSMDISPINDSKKKAEIERKYNLFKQKNNKVKSLKTLLK